MRPDRHSAGPLPVAMRLGARGQDVACENQWASSSIPHIGERRSLDSNGFALQAFFPNPHRRTQVRNVLWCSRKTAVVVALRVSAPSWPQFQ